MGKRGVAEWIRRPKIERVLFFCSIPKVPRQIEKELGLKKIKLKPFLEKQLLKCLNPEARKGRFYVLSNKARKLAGLSPSKRDRDRNWNLIGWIMSSPRQRLVVLQTIDSIKRTSEEIRERAHKLNPHLSRISTKAILKELLNKNLVKTEMSNRKRYYWISKKGASLIPQLH